ncbi:MAG: 50S ribosomal protein L22 [Deltaproteobacteria bacterium]|nr:50S ribosomal protein L22 [Deltaproteobacteria bacterium]
MEFQASLRYLRASPRKVRAVADLIRGKGVEDALNVLKFTRRSACGPLLKLVNSAVANASQKNKKLDADSLVVKSIRVDQGPTLRRFLTRSMGRANRINKKTSHVTVVLEEK